MNGLGTAPGRSSTDDADAFYRAARDPLEVDEEGIEMSSAPVVYGSDKGKGLVHKLQTDDEETSGASSSHTLHDARALDWHVRKCRMQIVQEQEQAL